MKKNLLVILSVCFIGDGLVFSQENESRMAYPEEIAGWSEAVKGSQREAGEALIPKIMQAIASEVSQFVIEPGHYRFSPDFLSQPVLIDQAADFKIVANDVTFWIEKPDGALLTITNSRNITIKGLTIDYDPLPFTQGTIVGLHPETKAILIEIDNGFPSPLDAHIGPAIEAGRKSRINIYTPEGVLRDNIRDDWVSGFERLTSGAWKMIMQGGWNFRQPAAALTPYKLGDKVVIPVRAGSLFGVRNSESVIFDQCTVYAAGGMVFSATDGIGNHVFNQVNIIPRPGTGRLMSAVADGIHSYNSEIGPVINECRLENLGDDAVAIHGFFGIAFKNQQASNVIEVVNPMVYNYREGMELEFYGFWDMDDYGSATIEDVEVLSGHEASSRVESFRADYERRGNRLRTFPNQVVYRIRLSKPVALPDDALMVNNDFVSAGFRVTNNRIRNILPRGILVKSANGIISGNDIAYVGHAGIALLSEADYWLEGPFNRNILIESNKVDHACISINSRMQPEAMGAIYVNVQKNADFTGKHMVKDVTIRNNLISNSGTPGISMNSAQGMIVENNIITNPVMLKPVNNINHYGIYVGCCKDLHIEGNQITFDHQWMISPLGYALCAETGSLYPGHDDDFLLYPNPALQSFAAEMTGQFYLNKTFFKNECKQTSDMHGISFLQCLCIRK
jgi:hypothetical protein